MTELSLEVSADHAGRVVIAVAGEVEMTTAPQLADCILEHTTTDVVVDLSEVTFLDSTGITALVHGYNELRKQGHTMRTTGERDVILRVLEISGLDGLFHGDTVPGD
ncbi:MAG TPA: STAS domain-containing protein [Acidimicrobiia bacterium]|nr:STAS domain-containing protein [Acidimicrobiia bacterium]